jgi:Holliday junction resolvase RusA-like endonuclease
LSAATATYQAELFAKPIESGSTILRLEGRVIPKQRPRFSKGHSYLPSGYRAWKDAAIDRLRAQYSGATLTRTSVVIDIIGSARGDLDNLAGAVLDALVQSGILADDRLSCVPELTVKHVPGKVHGAQVTLIALPPTTRAKR